MMISQELKNKILDKIGYLVEEKSIRLAPTDKGIMRNRIGHRVENNRVVIYCDIEYAEDMEFGRPPSILSETDKKQLDEWSERHNADPERIKKYIQKKGIKVGTPENPLHITSYGRNSYRPFLRPAIHQSIPEIENIIKKELSK